MTRNSFFFLLENRNNKKEIATKMLLKINLFIKRVIIKSIPTKRPNNRILPESPSLKSNRINERKTSAVPKSFCKIISSIGSKIIMKLRSFVENAFIFIL